jgi:hypothetical protein
VYAWIGIRRTRACRVVPIGRRRKLLEVSVYVCLVIHDVGHPQADEGALLYESRLRNFIAYLNAEVDTGYVRPTAAEYAVFDELSTDAASAEARLKAAIAATH